MILCPGVTMRRTSSLHLHTQLGLPSTSNTCHLIHSTWLRLSRLTFLLRILRCLTIHILACLLTLRSGKVVSPRIGSLDGAASMGWTWEPNVF